MNISRRLRGALGVAITWGVALSVVATSCLVAGIAAGLVPSSIFGPWQVVEGALRAFIGGALIGGLFSAALMTAERRRILATLPGRRVALWGFLAGAGKRRCESRGALRCCLASRLSSGCSARARVQQTCCRPERKRRTCTRRQ